LDAKEADEQILLVILKQDPKPFAIVPPTNTSLPRILAAHAQPHQQMRLATTQAPDRTPRANATPTFMSLPQTLALHVTMVWPGQRMHRVMTSLPVSLRVNATPTFMSLPQTSALHVRVYRQTVKVMMPAAPIQGVHVQSIIMFKVLLALNVPPGPRIQQVMTPFWDQILVVKAKILCR
jgi:hypothetical protein